jgi:hypothetical protein
VGGARRIGDVGEAIEMERAGHAHPDDQPGQRAGPRIDMGAKPTGARHNRADHPPTAGNQRIEAENSASLTVRRGRAGAS